MSTINILEDNKMTREEFKAQIEQFKERHPKFTSIVQEIPNLDVKQTVRIYLTAGVLQRMLKIHARNLVEERMMTKKNFPLEDYMTEEEIRTKAAEIKQNHPKFAGVVDGISNLDLKETIKGYTAAEVLQRLLRVHARNLVE